MKWHHLPSGDLSDAVDVFYTPPTPNPTPNPAPTVVTYPQYVPTPALRIPRPARKVIQGHYKPGSIKRNIANDGDVKLWTETAAATTPALKDELVLFFYKDVMAASKAGRIVAANIRVDLKWTVQFKDLRRTYRDWETDRKSVV